MSPRVEGERHRQSTQRATLKFELSTALELARSQPYREATETLISALTPLRWSNPATTAFVHLTLVGAKAELELPVLNVCADMSAWVASGYKTLSPVSKQIARHTEALLGDAFELIAIATQYHLKTFPGSLFPHENASDRALAKRIRTLAAELHSSSVSESRTLTDLETTAGLPAPKPQKKLLPTPKKPPVVARGTTAAGGKFVVRAERRSRRPDAVGCSAFITIEEPSRPRDGLLEILNNEGTSRCVSRSHVTPKPTVQCNSGLLTVEADLLPAARSVGLLLSNQRTITSPAIRVPARQGGPAGLYYQVVRGPSPIPVSLTELDAQGSPLAVLKLPAVVECTKHPIKYAPGGIVRLVHESVPPVPSFTIRAERFRKLGTSYFALKADVSEPRLFSTSGGNDNLFGTESESEAGPPSGVLGGNAIPLGGLDEGSPFAPHTSDGCEPQPYAIVYGLLKSPRDTVLAQVSGMLVPLRTVAIPARLHAGGVLAYGAFSPLPSELLVRSPSGKIIASENRSIAAKADTETCEGEAES